MPSNVVPSDAAEHLQRPEVPALSAMLGRRLPVLDDGFVRVVDYMGGDGSVVQAARVSYGAGTKHVSEDRGLIRYLLRHAHTTPFEMCEIKLHVRVPMDCWRQWIRHRTASVNEYSTRYSVAIDSAQQTPPAEWRSQSMTNKQGSSGEIADEAVRATLSARERELHVLSRTIYDERLAAGVAREQARKDLPLATYTEAYWKVDLHNLLQFLRLRMDPHAQHEIRQYANVIGEQLVAQWVPITWEAFCDFQRSSLRLSALERDVVRHLVSGDTPAAIAALTQSGLLTEGRPVKRSRERDDLEASLRDLGLTIPWPQST